MSPQQDSPNTALEKFRGYLECLTCIQIDPRLRAKFGWSDIIAKTLWEAYQGLEKIQGLDPEAQKRWLRQMLFHNLLEEVDRWKAGCRDFRLERPLEAAVEESSLRLRDWLAVEESSPSEKLIKQEESLRLLDALAQLPERQREALILQKYHGWKLAQIAAHLNCTMGVVAGLHARGLARLRQLLPEME